MMNTAKWVAIQTKSRFEKKVKDALVQKGYECFLPTYRKKKKWSHRTVELVLPLFPGYLFCRLDTNITFKIISTFGVKRIVGFATGAAEITEIEIKYLQELDKSDLLRKPWEYIPVGTLVKVKTGPLAGANGILCENNVINMRKDNSDDTGKTIVISMSILQRSILVKLDKDTMLSVIEVPRNRNKRNKVKHTKIGENNYSDVILSILNKE